MFDEESGLVILEIVSIRGENGCSKDNLLQIDRIVRIAPSEMRRRSMHKISIIFRSFPESSMPPT